MANTFLPTSLSLTSTFQQLSTLLEAAGITDASENPVASLPGYIKNNDTAIAVYIGQGTSAPASWATITAESAIKFDAGMNANEVWLKCASSTTTADFCEGASEYVPPLVNGVIGTITASENVVPKADADGNLVASTISDDASTVTVAADMSVTGTIVSDDATTPGLTIESGNTNTGFIDMKGKTSGKLRITVADATAQTVTLTTAAQTSGAGTITIPDLAGASTAPVMTALAQSITGVKTMTNPVLTAPVVNGATTAAAANNFDFSTGSGTFLTSTGANTISGAATFSSSLTTVTGTTALANLNTPAGTLKTTAIAGDLEYDGVNRYTTNNTTNGRSAIYADNYFRLTSTGSTISTIANYFGANSNIVLVSGGYYEIDIYAWFLKSTAGTVVWTFTNSAAPTAQDIYYEMSPATGIVAPPGDAGMLAGQIYNDATAAKALPATAALTDAVNHYMHTKIWLQNSTGTSLQIQATVSAGTITPGIGSRWFCRRLPAANTGLFAA